jgi:hypothetical protein
LTAGEVEIFEAARAAGNGLRRSFESWIVVGRAAILSKRMADSAGGNIRQRFRRYKAILASQSQDARSTSSRLLQVMDRLPEVEAWRAGLTDRERVCWSSPQSVFNRI